MKKKQEEIMVSVVMLTYNHEKYIKQSIESALNQKTNFKYEILVGDDASTDDTLKILKQYSHKKNVRLFFRKVYPDKEHSCHAAKNLYLLCKAAKGKYIIGLEGDDYWIKDDFLQGYVDYLENHPECIGVSGRRIVLSERTGKKTINLSKENCLRLYNLEDFLQKKKFDMCATLYRNIYRDKKYDYRFHTYSSIVGDFTNAVFILLHGDIYITDEIMGVYRVDRIKNASAYNATKSRKEIYEDHINLIKKLEKNIPERLDFTYRKIKYTKEYLDSISNTVCEQVKAIIYIIRTLGIKFIILNIRAFYIMD